MNARPLCLRAVLGSRRAASLVLGLGFALGAGCDSNDVSLGSDVHAPASSSGGVGAAGMHADAGSGGGGGSGGSGGSGSTTGTGTGSGGSPSITSPDAGTTPAADAGMTPAGCPQGTGDCDGRTDNGCETNFASDVAHCGKCDITCPGLGIMSFGSTCMAGVCVLNCESPFANCDGDLNNGCESLGPCP